MKRNIQHRRPARCIPIGRWALNVQCSVFVLVITFLAAALPLQGQTNDLQALAPPYGELPPTFLEQHGTSVVFAGLGAIALAAFGIWLVFRPMPKIIIPSEVQAREALKNLRQQPEDGEPRLAGCAALIQRGVSVVSRRTHHHGILPRNFRQ